MQRIIGHLFWLGTQALDIGAMTVFIYCFREREQILDIFELVSGQRPWSAILGCADSRVPPEVIFDVGPGDMFTVRVAGNVLSDATLASVEYAAGHLGAGLVLVMGHSQCGAVQAALDAHVALRRVAIYSQSPDHPVIPAIPETEYLKGFAYEVIR